MSIKKQIDDQTLEKLEEALTSELQDLRADALKRASVINGEPVNIHSLHGMLGGKNAHYVDSIRLQFSSPQDFISRWIEGLLDKVKTIENEQREKYNGNIYQDTSYHKIVRLVQDPIIFDYLEIFLTRNFYRNLNERTRAKPNDIHWSLWFGENQLPWGLLIAPSYHNGIWINDAHKIHRARYMYWSIEHVLSTGFIDPESSSPVSFQELNDLIKFYNSVLKRLSRSQYEKQLVDLYLDLLSMEENPNEIPLLIPELRYAGLQAKHLYRLDFSILNSHAMEYIGFELSPQSTHMALKGAKGRTQKALNEELKDKWNKEMSKRNDYFLRYGISIITFTDDDLQDINSCFSVVKKYLLKKPKKPLSLASQIKELENFTIHYDV